MEKGWVIESGLVAKCGVIEFELLWSTRSPAEYDQVSEDRNLAYEWPAIEDVDRRRALYVQKQLWRANQMRTVPLPDLLIAALAERSRITVLHYDADFDRIAAVTNQPARWVVPHGSVP